MKYFILLSLIILLTSCTSDQPPTIFTYSDYPPPIVENHLEQEFDTVKWFAYRWYARAVCVQWSDQDFAWDKNGKPMDPPMQADRIAANQIVTRPIVLDSLIIKGDSAMFYTNFALNDSIYCDYIRFPSLKGKPGDHPLYIGSNVILSIAMDTIVSVYDGHGAMFIDNKPLGGLRSIGSPDKDWRHQNEMRLKEQILANEGIVHPWLLKQAEKRGWLKDSITHQ